MSVGCVAWTKALGCASPDDTVWGWTCAAASNQDVLVYVNQFPVGSGRVANTDGAWHHVRIAIRDHRCRVTVDGNVAVEKHLLAPLPSHGGIALAAYAGGVGRCTVYYDNVVVIALEGESDP